MLHQTSVQKNLRTCQSTQRNGGRERSTARRSGTSRLMLFRTRASVVVSKAITRATARAAPVARADGAPRRCPNAHAHQPGVITRPAHWIGAMIQRWRR
jgi:hypothetical protein